MTKTEGDGKEEMAAASSSSTTPPSSPLSSPWIRTMLISLYLIGFVQLLVWACKQAYEIRLFAIKEFGRVIHEFDPYFNYRATEYLWANGAKKFFTWFDYMSWYPLGRPVGTTIYPGMQFTSVYIKKFLLPDWSINDICCFVPAWFGILATLSVALLTYECTSEQQPFGCIFNDIPIVNIVYRKVLLPLLGLLKKLLVRVTGSSWGLEFDRKPGLECACFAAAIMAVVPAHIMRSVGGGYDNESIATTAMATTFFLWTRSLRGTEPNYVYSVLSGLAYFYMVAAWGGYVFVINLIGLHASLLVAFGRYSTKLHRAYTLFYLVGTTLAIQVPVVGWTPLRSLEQMGPLLAFGGIQLIEFCEVMKRRRQLSVKETWKLRIAVFTGAALFGALVVYFLAPTGYFGPISSRVRGLFIKHTKTGNPLVDSVAEHQPASPNAYFQYLHDICYLAPIGFLTVALFGLNDSSSFLLVYGGAAYFFSHRMVRLILLTAPIASSLGGVALGHAWAWCVGCITSKQPTFGELLESEVEKDESQPEGASKKDTNGTGKTDDKSAPSDAAKDVASKGDPILVRVIRFAASIYLIYRIRPYAVSFYESSFELAKNLSHPTIIQKAKTRDGRVVTIDDYREAYLWLHDNTPEDARVMAWWDYGYQIAGIANRTTIADGNTWNHEHIALLGRTLTSPEKDAHRIARHLADYVLVWAGGGGDDLAKSPHLRRIANSVYRNLCPGDPTCRSFGFANGKPSSTMEASLLYKLCSHNQREGVQVDKNRFKEVFTSKYGKVRIYKVLSVSKESKEWVADPANRICDAPGSWFCRGQYPPALQKILKEKKDFKQLEDFNAKREDDSEYQRQYHENLKNPDKARAQAARHERANQKSESEAESDQAKLKKIPQEEIDQVNEVWENTDLTNVLYDIIDQDDKKAMYSLFVNFPEAPHARSKDGRGPMFWAHEKGRSAMVTLMRRLGVSEELKDEKGLTPLDLSTIKEK